MPAHQVAADVRVVDEHGLAKRQFGHGARLALSPAEIRIIDGQAHAARTMSSCLHSWWTTLPKDKRTLAAADEAILQRPPGQLPKLMVHRPP